MGVAKPPNRNEMCQAKIVALLLINCAILKVSGSPLPLATGEEEKDVAYDQIDRNARDLEVERRQSSNDTDGDDKFVESCRKSGLCPEGIASFAAAGAAMGLLGCLACVTWHWEVQAERRARIKMAQARNRDVDRLAESRRDTSVHESIKTAEEEGRMFGVEHDDLGMEMSDAASSSDEHRALLRSEDRSPIKSEPLTPNIEVTQ